MSADSKSTEARKGTLRFRIGVALLIATLPASYYFLLARTPVRDEPPQPVAPTPQVLELAIDQVSGQVEVRRTDGEWRAAAPGDLLKSSDSVRTQAGSSAQLKAGDAYEVRLEPGTEVSVNTLTRSISRLLLANGMASATVKREARHTFEVAAGGSDAAAKTSAGSFTVTNDGKGTVAVGTTEGEVEFAGGGKVVIVRAGQQSLVTPGNAPTAPATIPGSLLLKVKWPAEGTLNRRSFVLSGETEPGAMVEVQGKVVHPDSRGRFSEGVKLSEGKVGLRVEVRAVGGRANEAHKEVKVDTTPPGVQIRPPWR